MKRIYVVGTADTKGEELAYLAERDRGRRRRAADRRRRHAKRRRSRPTLRPPRSPRTGRQARRKRSAPATAAAPSPRWPRPSRASPQRRDDIAGIIGIGGGGGTSIVTAGMRELPLGLPKIMVSTLASGDVSPYVGVSDIVMMPSITDMAGLNRISRVVLANAAQAIVGMARSPPPSSDGKPAHRPHHVRRHHALRDRRSSSV